MSDEPQGGSFADYPVSIGEVRSEKEADGTLWTPRDCLIDLLRKIDSGAIKVDTLVIFARKLGDEATMRSVYSQASPGVHISLGVAQLGLARMIDDIIHSPR